MLDRYCEVSKLAIQGKEMVRFWWTGTPIPSAHPTGQNWDREPGLPDSFRECSEELLLMLQIKLQSSPDLLPNLHLRKRKLKSKICVMGAFNNPKNS